MATYEEIKRQADQRFGSKPSSQKLAWQQSQQRAAGLEPEKKRRGGAAGFWDRNKAAIKQVVPVALGFIPGVGVPLAAGARAAMEGFDRPGKGGIGFDVKAGARGALQGAMQGTTGAGLKAGFSKVAGGLKGMFAPNTAVPGGATPSLFASGSARAALAPTTTALKTSTLAPTVGGVAPSLTTTGGAVASKSLLKDLFTAEGLGGLTKGALAGYQGYQTNATDRARLAQDQRQFERTAALAEQRFGEEQRAGRLAEQKFAEEQRLAKLDEERRRRVASLMALFAPKVLRGFGEPQAQGGAQGGAMG